MRVRGKVHSAALAGMAVVTLLTGCDSDEVTNGETTGEGGGSADEEPPSDADEGSDEPDDAGGADGPEAGGLDGTDDAPQDGDGLEVLLAIDPACAEVGSEFTAIAEGLEPDAEHVIRIDPAPSETGEFEPEVPATSDAEGTLEVSTALPADVGIEAGSYVVSLAAVESSETGEELISSDLRIADSCD